jgi:hypothetical protein
MALERQLAFLDAEIAHQERAMNALVFGLYGLSAEEIEMVEKGYLLLRSYRRLAPEPASVPGSGTFLRHRGHCGDYPFEREDHNDFGAFAKLGFQGEGSAMEFDEALHDRQTEAGAFLGVFLRERATTERGHDNGDLVFRNSGTAVAHSHILAAARGPADPDLDRSALRSELDRV